MDSCCRLGDECGRGGSSGVGVAGSVLGGGLCERGVALMTPAPPPSNGPGTSGCGVGSAEGGRSGSRPRPGVESGLGTHSDIFGDAGLTRSGEEVLVSATDSPRSGQTSHYLKSYITMLHLHL